MPILQSENPVASVLGPLLGLAAGFVKNNVERKQADQKRQDALKQQGITNQNASNQTAIAANNAGMVVGPDGKVAPWTPPSAAGTGSQPSQTPSQPGIAGLLAGLAQSPPQANLGPKAPKMGAPVSDAVMKGLPASVTGQASPQTGAQPTAPPGVPPELIHTASVSQAMADHLTQLAQGEQQQADTLASQGAPAVLVKRHTDAAKGYLTEAGEQTGKYLDAQKQIGMLTTAAKGQAQTDAAQKFVKGENPLPSDPKARLAVLLKRMQIERGVPGVDTKATQDMITEAQRQITDAENRAHQAKTDANASTRLQISIDRGNRPGKEDGSGDNPKVDALYDRAVNAKTPQEALRIVDDPHNGLTYTQRRQMREDIKDAGPQKVKPKTTLQTVQESAGYRAIPAQYQTVITAELKKGATVDGIRSMVNTSKMDDTSKKLILTALNGL